MDKFRAFFAGIVVVAVVGASALFWYLGNDGKSLKEKLTEAGDAVFSADIYSPDIDYGNNNNYDDHDEEPGNGAEDTPEDTDDMPDDENKENDDQADIEENNGGLPSTDISAVDVNEFLSVFSRVYFSENNEYSYDDYSDYEVLRFAYSHIFRTDREAVVTKQTDDNIGYYFGVSYDYVNDILEDHLGITVRKRDAYTENTYAFFKYEDGYFYTPAAEGIRYTNLAIADSIEPNDEKNGYTVGFTIYSDSVSCDMSASEAAAQGEKYGYGTAEIVKNGNTFALKSYKVIK